MLANDLYSAEWTMQMRVNGALRESERNRLGQMAQKGRKRQGSRLSIRLDTGKLLTKLSSRLSQPVDVAEAA